MREILQLPEQLTGRVWFMDGESPYRNLQPHCHDELEFNLVSRGEATYLLKNRRYHLQAGAFVWLFPRQNHILIDTSPDFQMWIGVFAPAMVHQFCCLEPKAHVLSKTNPSGGFLRLLSNRNSQTIVTTSELLYRTESIPELHQAGLTWLLRLAWDAWSHASADTRFQEIHPAVEKAVRALRANPALGLPEVAHAAHISPARLSRLFHHDMGCTLTTFRNACRLQRFTELYGQGKRRTMLDCALEAGFGSYEQFHRIYRKQRETIAGINL